MSTAKQALHDRKVIVIMAIDSLNCFDSASRWKKLSYAKETKDSCLSFFSNRADSSDTLVSLFWKTASVDALEQTLQGNTRQTLLFIYSGWSISRDDTTLFSAKSQLHVTANALSNPNLVQEKSMWKNRLFLLTGVDSVNIYGFFLDQLLQYAKMHGVRQQIIILDIVPSHFTPLIPYVAMKTSSLDQVVDDSTSILIAMKNEDMERSLGICLYQGLSGKADKCIAGNNDGIMSFYELSAYLDAKYFLWLSDSLGAQVHPVTYITVGRSNVEICKIQ